MARAVISASEAKAEAYPWRTVALSNGSTVAYEGPAELEELSLYAAVARQGVEQAFDFEPCSLDGADNAT